MAKKVRVLVDTNIDGVDYKIDNVVELKDNVAKTYINAGVVDAAPEAVDYALSQEGAEVIVHGAAPAVVEQQPAGQQQPDNGPAA